MARDEFYSVSRGASQTLRNSRTRDRAPGGAGFSARPAGSFNEIVSYFIFVVMVFIGLTILALFKFRREEPNGVSYLTPGYPVTPIVFLVLIVFMLVLLAGNNPTQAFLGVAVVALSAGLFIFVS